MNVKLYSIYPSLKGWRKKKLKKDETQNNYVFSSKYQTTKLKPKKPFKPL